MKGVLSLILGGGRGTRLYPLTRSRSKPAMPVAGKYRLIDIPISNCINSGFNRIYVLTQFLSVSLHQHISNTYKFDMFNRGFVEVLAAQQTNEAADWYQGTADAVRQNLRYVQQDGSPYTLILSGDQLYRMNFRDMLATHEKSQADVTIAVIPVPRNQVEGFGIMRVNDQGRILSFVEKPKTEAEVAPYFTPQDWIERQGISCNGRHFLASMGIYLFNRDVLLELLSTKPLATDFGKEVFPRSLESHKIHAHLFDGYWEDLGTIKSYHEASLALASDNPPFEFHAPDSTVYTRMRNLPPSRLNNVILQQSMISDGVVILGGSRIERSVIGVRARIGRDVTIRETVVIGSDKLETEIDRAENRKKNIPDMNVGDGCIIERAILDKDCRIGRNVRIFNRDGVSEFTSDEYCIRDGIVVIPRGTIIPDGTVI